jgi:DNA-directed RNA polymerase III subunit RPC1
VSLNPLILIQVEGVTYADVPQTEEARTEALELMNVEQNLVTPRNGEPVIAAIQDFITSSYLISRKDRFFDRQQFTQICCYLADANLQIDIPPPTIWKPARLWTGKQVFNVLMRPNKASGTYVNVESKCLKMEEPKAENYPVGMNPAPDMSPNDGWLVIVNSEIMCGSMDKATVGSGKKKSIFGVIMRDYGPREAAVVMNRLAKLCARWLGESFANPSRSSHAHMDFYSKLRFLAGYQRRYSWTEIDRNERLSC